jgi:hypothetical protein
MKEMGGWSPKPAPARPTAQASCVNPHGTPRPTQNVALWLHYRVRATFWPVLRSIPGRDFSTYADGCVGLTESTWPVGIVQVSPMGHSGSSQSPKHAWPLCLYQ